MKLMPKRRRVRATIVYKSGAVVKIRCREVSVRRNLGGGVSELSWDDARPRPLYAGIGEIAAVYTKVGR